MRLCCAVCAGCAVEEHLSFGVLKNLGAPLCAVMKKVVLSTLKMRTNPEENLHAHAS